MSLNEDPSVLPDGWTWSDIGHGVLDVVGLVPVVGEAADLTNAAWHAAEGNYLDAGLSLISCVPVIGDIIGKGGKVLGKVGGKAGGKVVKEALEILRKADFSKLLEKFRTNPKLAPHIDKMIEALNKWRDDILNKFSDAPPGGTASCPNAVAGTKNKIDALKSKADNVVKNGDFSTAENKSVFYSGPGNRELAVSKADEGFVAIDNTKGGDALIKENLYGKGNPLESVADEYWQEASKKFAKGASGDVTAYVHGASPNRVFAQTELPTLLANENVKTINGIPRKLLLHLESKNPGSAFLAVTGSAPIM